jgi:hypothetical protein
MPNIKPNKKVAVSKGQKAAGKRLAKQNPFVERAAKKVKKASASSRSELMKAAGMQRREMARTRLVQQEGRMTAAERKKVTDRAKQKRLDKMGKVTSRKFRESL